MARPASTTIRDAVLVGARSAQHRLAFTDAFDRAQAIPKTRRELIVATLSGRVHLVTQLVVQLLGASLHEFLDLLQQLRVVGSTDPALARGPRSA